MRCWLWVGVVVSCLIHVGCVGPTLGIGRAGDGTGTVTSDPAGIDCGDTCAMIVDVDEAITLTATPASGSRFAGWSGGGCSGVDPCLVNLSTDTRIIATFEALPPPSYHLAVSLTGEGRVDANGIACGSDCEEDFVDGTNVMLLASPSVGWRFLVWRGVPGCDSNPTCTVTVSASVEIEAVFELGPPVELTVLKAGSGSGEVSSSPAGIDCGSDCTELYPVGAAVLLDATPAVGSSFAGWSGGACAGATGPCALMVSAATTVTATFDSVASRKNLTSVSFLVANNPGLAFDVTATITGTNIKATVPTGTDLTALRATFTTTGVSVLVGGVTQTSSVTGNDFTASLVYQVTAADASTKDYAVTVRLARPLVFAKTDVATGPQPMFLAIADLNGDGRPDLGVTTAGTPATDPASVSIVLNTTAMSAVTPSFSGSVSYLAGANPGSIAFGDIDGDGRPDLVATTGPSTFSVLRNTTTTNATTPSFSAAAAFGAGGGQFLAIGDVNRDGKPDVAVVSGSGVSVFLNTTATTATAPTFSTKVEFPAGLAPFAVAIGDLNGDGAPDLAVANESANTVSIFLNTTAANATTPSFTAKVDVVTGVGTSPAPYAVAIGDLDGDGRADLAVANAAQTVSSVSVFLNTTATAATTPSFAAKLDVAMGSGPVCVVLGDLDNDGKPDLAAAKSASNNVSVVRDLTAPNATSPVFAPREDFATGALPRSVALGDFNGDGTPDLAVANQGSQTVSVMIAQ